MKHLFKTVPLWNFHCGSVVTNPTDINENAGWIPGLACELSIWYCHELCCGSKMWLRSRVAVAVVSAGSYSSDSTPSLGTSIYCGCSPKKTKRKSVPFLGNFIGRRERGSRQLSASCTSSSHCFPLMGQFTCCWSESHLPKWLV